MLSPRQEAIQFSRDRMALDPLYLDTETTGIDRFSEIVEVCVTDNQGSVIFESLVKPTRPIPRDATRIHGISDAHIQNAPSWLVVWPQLEQALAGHTVGIYNAEFDLRMLQQTHMRYKMPSFTPNFTSFCIMKLFAQYVGEWNRATGSYRFHSLENAGRRCRIPLPNTHRAHDDCLLARAVLQYMADDAGLR
jgi:DNA polymerase-3 subunit epsilon